MRDTVAFAVAQGQADEIAVVEDVVMRQRRPLGRARGAGGVLDVDGVVALQLRLAPLHVREVHRSPRAQEAVPVGIEREGVAQRGAAWPHGFEHGRIRRLPKAAAVQEHATPDLSQDVFQLVGLVGGVDVDEDGADAGGGVLKDDPLVAVGGPDADAVAGGDAESEQAASGIGGRVPQLPIGGAIILRADDQRFAVAVARRRCRAGCRRWFARAGASRLVPWA